MGKMRVDQFERAGKAWSILVECARNGQLITYGQLAARMGIHHRVCRFFLGIIQDYCLKNSLLPLQSLVVNKKSRKPGAGYFASPTDQIEKVHNEVFNNNWDKLSNPFR